ncbi:hypothetical protein BGZ61DRAFT_441874 [Ilyonectria robusta]|uniref:uncharacterized protein n=1 Tax=Ilyonectria robusta TaxID=1079257 RepID=UPI001E8CFE16|nr:uncharacterized protein BGZ61DRAFT_441874 [Ilyonectria robusta]KAH8736350.1 hypothetical protein BGZ61DRAFT_441874 [Ilyonectria robusta]
MRSQYRTAVAIAIPNHIPSKVVLAFIQTYDPLLRHNPGIVSFEEIPFDIDDISNDPFFGPMDDTVRNFQVREVIWLAPGLTKDMNWPMIYQCTPDGIRNRGNALAGIIGWTQWAVRPRQGNTPPIGSGSRTLKTGDEWELWGEVTVEANSLLMPFISNNAKNFLEQICQGVIDEIVATPIRRPQ